MANKAVFLDRDGVLNRAIIVDGKPLPPSNLAELEIVPDAPAALADLRRFGFLLIVVTNQPDVSRGTQDRHVVEALNSELKAVLQVDDFLVCYHDDPDHCECRKPLPGLIFQAARKYSISLPDSFLIGDRWRDIEAGLRAGCATILIESGYHEDHPAAEPHTRVKSLREAVDWISQNMIAGNAALSGVRGRG